MEIISIIILYLIWMDFYTSLFKKDGIGDVAVWFLDILGFVWTSVSKLGKSLPLWGKSLLLFTVNVFVIGFIHYQILA